jgi:hypothetical protein
MPRDAPFLRRNSLLIDGSVCVETRISYAIIWRGVIAVDEMQELLKSILHQLELLNARQDRMEDDISTIKEQLVGQNKRITDHNHRIADIEQELRLGQ